MARAFDLTDDKIVSTATYSLTDFSITYWYRKVPAVAGAYDEVWTHGNGANYDGTTVWMGDASTGDLAFARARATTDSAYVVTGTNMVHAGSATKWLWVGISSTGTSAPVVYHSDPATDPGPVSRTVTTVGAGSGAAVTTARVANWGGWTDATLGFGGDMAFCALYNVALTAQEMYEVMWTGYTTRGLIDFRTMWGDTGEPSLSGNTDDATVTGTTVLAANPPLRPFLIPPRPYFHRTAVAAAVVYPVFPTMAPVGAA